jgi:hypothetical protein
VVDTPQLIALDVDDEIAPGEEVRQPSPHRITESRLAREKAILRRDWLAAGGAEAEFEDAWPSIQTQLGRIRVAEIGERARARSLAAFRGSA